ncbi:MAG: hypothetical protein U0U46_03595 [Saprospiraceae bacterium]
MQLFYDFQLLIPALALGSIIEVIGSLIDETMSGPGTRAWNNRVQRLRDALKKFTGGLVPWDAEMLRLLSLNKVQAQKEGWFGRPAGGVFTSIYQEPVLAFVREALPKSPLLMASTSQHELVFRLKGKETEIWVDRQPLGVLANGALLAAGRGSKLLAQLDMTRGTAQNLLQVGNQPAATLLNPELADTPMPRAVTLLRDLTAEEETIVLALAVLRMTRSIG